MVKRLLVGCLFFLSGMLAMPGNSLATHIVGGELNYKYLGNNRYEIRLTVYRDCFNGIPPFDSPASLGIFASNNTLFTSINMPFRGLDTLPPTINTPCFTPPLTICYEVTTYIDTIVLPPFPGGYKLAYQRCCRNQSILNIISPGATGATYYATIPDPSTIFTNSNPVFKQWPDPFVCVNAPLVFDHSAIDPDGDSLVYELCVPFDGASQGNPMPQPPFNPPYNPVSWQSPYSLNNMLGGVPMEIDSVTGLLTATPNTLGQFVYGVCVKEYRNGVYVSETRRDFQVNVIQCPTLLISSFIAPSFLCGSNTVQFTNTSIGAGSHHWDFGVANTNSDTSNLVNPSFTFPDTGTYVVSLVAASQFFPNCRDTSYKTIRIYPNLDADFTFTTDPCNYQVLFTDTTDNTSGPTAQWNWTFGDGGTSTIHNPPHTYPGPGTFPITLIVRSAGGCRDTVYKSVTLDTVLTISTQPPSMISCKGFCDGQATVLIQGGDTPMNILWNDPGAQTTPTANSLCPGSYTVIVTDANNCSASRTVIITEPPVLAATQIVTEAYCNGACIGSSTVFPSGGSAPSTILWNDPAAQTTFQATSLCPGIYTYVVTDANGCTYSDSVNVLFSTAIPQLIATVDDDTLFAGQSTTAHATIWPGYTYAWSPVTGLSNPSVAEPIATPLVTTTYTILITDSLGCTNIDTVTIWVKVTLCDDPEVFIPNAFSPNSDNQNDKLFVRGGSLTDIYFTVYDRWGQQVFESTDKNKGWDGTYKGKEAAPGVYVYYLQATCYGGLKYFKKGNITLLR